MSTPTNLTPSPDAGFPHRENLRRFGRRKTQCSGRSLGRGIILVLSFDRTTLDDGGRGVPGPPPVLVPQGQGPDSVLKESWDRRTFCVSTKDKRWGSLSDIGVVLPPGRPDQPSWDRSGPTFVTTTNLSLWDRPSVRAKDPQGPVEYERRSTQVPLR